MMKLYKYMDGTHDLAQLPPQAAAIVEEVKRGGVVKRDDLLRSLEVRFESYNQSPKNVLSFYRKRLIEQGFMMELTV